MESRNAPSNEFMIEASGPPGVFGVFEDDGQTGYLYLYEPGGREVFQHLHVYDRTPDLSVHEEDVRIIWSNDLSKVGVIVWGKMRGIINLATGNTGRVWLESRNTAGIDDPEWLKGFLF